MGFGLTQASVSAQRRYQGVGKEATRMLVHRRHDDRAVVVHLLRGEMQSSRFPYKINEKSMFSELFLFECTVPSAFGAV